MSVIVSLNLYKLLCDDFTNINTTKVLQCNSKKFIEICTYTLYKVTAWDCVIWVTVNCYNIGKSKHPVQNYNKQATIKYYNKIYKITTRVHSNTVKNFKTTNINIVFLISTKINHAYIT